MTCKYQFHISREFVLYVLCPTEKGEVYCFDLKYPSNPLLPAAVAKLAFIIGFATVAPQQSPRHRSKGKAVPDSLADTSLLQNQ